MPDPDLTDELRSQTKAAWYRYLELIVPFRPDLHRYCRALARDIWDAEDLLQDTLLKGFATLGVVNSRIENPRGYLIRIATNLWIDIQRRRGSESNIASTQAVESQPSRAASPSQSIEVREAAATLLTLAPRERAAVLLKDVFQMELKEIASILSTSLGAVKAALHRGRNRLRDAQQGSPRQSLVSRKLVDEFVAFYND